MPLGDKTLANIQHSPWNSLLLTASRSAHGIISFYPYPSPCYYIYHSSSLLLLFSVLILKTLQKLRPQ